MWHFRTPYDSASTPGYEITYVQSVIAITYIGYTISSTDCVFMGIAQQITACYKELQDMLKDTDQFFDTRFGCFKYNSFLRYNLAHF